MAFARQWPLKPDVVFEGANLVHNHKGEVDFSCGDLSLLSTHHRPSAKSFVLSDGTSAAAAQVARMAAIISAERRRTWNNWRSPVLSGWPPWLSASTAGMPVLSFRPT